MWKLDDLHHPSLSNSDQKVCCVLVCCVPVCVLCCVVLCSCVVFLCCVLVCSCVLCSWAIRAIHTQAQTHTHTHTHTQTHLLPFPYSGLAETTLEIAQIVKSTGGSVSLYDNTEEKSSSLAPQLVFRSDAKSKVTLDENEIEALLTI